MPQTPNIGTPSPRTHDHMAAPPDWDIWVRGLRMRGYRAAVQRLRSDVNVDRHFARSIGAWSDLHGVLDAVGDDPDIRRNALLVARYVEQRKLDAVAYAAHAVLGAERTKLLSTDGGRLRRVPAALAMFLEAPGSLLNVLIWDQWHSRNRVVYKLKDRAKRMNGQSDSAWLDLATSAIASVGRVRPQLVEHLSAERVIRHEPTGTVMVALREGARPDVLHDENGGPVEGHHTDWLLLGFRDDGYHLHVVDGSGPRGRLLGTEIAKSLWSSRDEYVLAGKEAASEQLSEFLRLLTSPNNDDFQLLEITAEMPGFNGAPVITVTNGGMERVEGIVHYLRREAAFAEGWRTVLSAKMAYDGYRFLIEFPRPNEPRLLTYSVKQRPEPVSEAFAGLLRDRFEIDARPRSPKKERALLIRTPERKDPPPVRSASWWSALLQEKLDEPKKWEMEALKWLTANGMISPTRHLYFGCGDDTFDHARLGLTWGQCDGEIEMPYGQADEDDPYLQEKEAKFECRECKKVYKPHRHRIHAKKRMRLNWNHPGVWTYLKSVVSSISEVDARGAPAGVAGVIRGATRYHLAYGPLLADGLPIPPEFARLITLPFFAGESLGGPSLAQVLADPTALAAAWGGDRAPIATSAPPAAVSRAQPSTLAEPENTVVQRGKAMVLNDVKIAAGQAHGQKVVLALLNDIALKDQRRGGARTRHTSEALADRLRGPNVNVVEGNVRGWIAEVNGKFRAACFSRDEDAKDVIEHGAMGYMLAPWVHAADLKLARTISNWHARLENNKHRPSIVKDEDEDQ